MLAETRRVLGGSYLAVGGDTGDGTVASRDAKGTSEPNPTACPDSVTYPHDQTGRTSTRASQASNSAPKKFAAVGDATSHVSAAGA